MFLSQFNPVSLSSLIAYSYTRQHLGAERAGLLDPTPPPLTLKPHGPMPERLALTHFGPEEVAPNALEGLPLLIIAPGQEELGPEQWARFQQRRSQHGRLLAPRLAAGQSGPRRQSIMSTSTLQKW